MVNISLRVLARPDAAKLPDMYRLLGTDYDERVLPSICNEVCVLCYLTYAVSQFVFIVNSTYDGTIFFDISRS